jgi:hypothetical protein
MLEIMRFVPLVMAGLGSLVAACSTTGTLSDARFSVHPFSEFGRQKLERTEPQKGTRSLVEPNRRNFREMTIAQGSGLDGFDSLRIFADGKGYAVVGLSWAGPPKDFRPRRLKGIQVPIQLSSAKLDGLLTAMRQDQLHRIKGQYSSGLADGSQGFVEAATSGGRVYSCLDNYFEPVAHTYQFCNEEIWPQVRRDAPQSLSQPRYDLQEEYHRVFKE